MQKKVITGTWMEKENYRMHGLVSQDSYYWTKGHLMRTHCPGGDLQGNKKPLVPGHISVFFCAYDISVLLLF